MLSELTITYALSFLGTPYIWGGQSPQGADCSGFVIMVLQAEGILPNKFDATSQGLHTYFRVNGAKKVRSPSQGCLAFYGKSVDRITHVALCLDGNQVIEAAGGDSTTNTAEDAAARGAHVRIRKLRYRSDLVDVLSTDINKIVPIKSKP
jgi:cell wall-associated NlpC family hydrolase